jgi:phenylalanyl-tRNA synthetase beta chain
LTIRKTAKRLGINSDAKYRFERGVDTGFVTGGLDMATHIILDICGGEASEMMVAGEIPAAPAPVSFDPAITKKLTGMDIDDSEAARILTTLGFGVDSAKTPWTITVPSRRRDVSMAADLVEDITRIAGYDRLPATSLPKIEGRREALLTPAQNTVRLARRALAGRGLSEAITWAFCSREHAQLFGGGDALEIILDNPISAELDTMRPSALIHLLLAGQRSANQGYPRAAIFESGAIYQSDDPQSGQSRTLAGIRRAEIARSYDGNSAPDALTVKADALAALAAMGTKVSNLQIVRGASDYFHPGRSGRLQMGPKKTLAQFGELHPRVLTAMGIDAPVMAFEIFPDAVPLPRKKSASKSKGALALSGLMPVHRDFAFIVPDNVAAGDVIKAAKGADKALITDVTLFDIYAGKGVEDGHKSLAIDVTISPKAATLTDKDIDVISDRIITQVAKTGGVLRG